MLHQDFNVGGTSTQKLLLCILMLKGNKGTLHSCHSKPPCPDPQFSPSFKTEFLAFTQNERGSWIFCFERTVKHC
jgi:hypothetical protein